MYPIRPVGPAACARALVMIRVAGERFTRGCSCTLLSELQGLLAFLLRASDCLEWPC